MLYFLMLAMYPRFLITLDENLKVLSTTVRVGQAVDTVGQAGRPKTITGFQTHNTPVLMAHTDRAELATEECKLNSYLLADLWFKQIDNFSMFRSTPDSRIGRICHDQEESRLDQ